MSSKHDGKNTIDLNQLLKLTLPQVYIFAVFECMSCLFSRRADSSTNIFRKKLPPVENRFGVVLVLVHWGSALKKYVF